MGGKLTWRCLEENNRTAIYQSLIKFIDVGHEISDAPHRLQWLLSLHGAIAIWCDVTYLCCAVHSLKLLYFFWWRWTVSNQLKFQLALWKWPNTNFFWLNICTSKNSSKARKTKVSHVLMRKTRFFCSGFSWWKVKSWLAYCPDHCAVFFIRCIHVSSRGLYSCMNEYFFSCEHYFK